MAFTYGFYNSINHDRRYDAIQMSSIFDGIIEDGIFMTIGDHFNVTANNSMTLTVGTGRAWFNHTWSLNDAKMLITLPVSDLILTRYDAIVIEVNSRQEYRENSIKVVQGTPASNPVYPTLMHTTEVNQYPLAYVKVAGGASIIRQADVTNMVGKDDCPYVTGPLKSISIETMVAQWEDQWKAWFETHTKDWTTEWNDFYKEQNALITEAAESWKEEWETWYTEHTVDWSSEFNTFYENQTNLMLESKLFWDTKLDEYYSELQDSMDVFEKQSEAEFRKWVVTIKKILDTEAAGNLQNEIEVLKEQLNALSDFRNRRIWETEDGDIYELNKYSIAGSRWATLEVNQFLEDGSIVRRYYMLEAEGTYILEQKLLITFPNESGVIANYTVQDTESDEYELDPFVTSTKWWD